MKPETILILGILAYVVWAATQKDKKEDKKEKLLPPVKPKPPVKPLPPVKSEPPVKPLPPVKSEPPVKPLPPVKPPQKEVTVPYKKDGYTEKFFDFTYIDSAWEQRANKTVDNIFANRSRYENVASELNRVPWYIIAIVHSLESDLNFSRHLHNGDPLSGRTYHVPKGRPTSGNPPFTWEESAIDAIKMKNWHNWVDWTVKDVLYRLEIFNGKGYMNRGVLSPYVWSGSNYGLHTGKYVADGRYDPHAVSQQVGCALLLKKIFDRLGYKLEKVQPVEKKPDAFLSLEEELKLLFNQRDIKYFQAKEFLKMGGAHEEGRCKNTLPPREYLSNIADVAKMWDDVREYWGQSIVVNSVYRSEAYNKCVGGASKSYHKKGMAADCSPLNGNVSSLANAIYDMKKQGKITGGWGVYSTFIHLDIRGYEVKFK